MGLSGLELRKAALAAMGFGLKPSRCEVEGDGWYIESPDALIDNVWGFWEPANGWWQKDEAQAWDDMPHVEEDACCLPVMLAWLETKMARHWEIGKFPTSESMRSGGPIEWVYVAHLHGKKMAYGESKTNIVEAVARLVVAVAGAAKAPEP